MVKRPILFCAASRTVSSAERLVSTSAKCGLEAYMRMCLHSRSIFLLRFGKRSILANTLSFLSRKPLFAISFKSLRRVEGLMNSAYLTIWQKGNRLSAALGLSHRNYSTLFRISLGDVFMIRLKCLLNDDSVLYPTRIEISVTGSVVVFSRFVAV